MPVYTYQCSGCSHIQDDIQSMANRDSTVECDKCGRHAFRQAEPELAAVQTDWPEAILSDAAGIAPEQVAEARGRFKGHDYTPDGRMIFKSKKHRQKCLKDIGMVDRDGFD